MANKHISNCLISLAIMEIQIKAADPIAPSENGCCIEQVLTRAWNMRNSGALMCGGVIQSIHFLEQYKSYSKK